MAEKKKDMSKPANNANLNWDNAKDQPAIEAVREIAKERGKDLKETLRWVCVVAKNYCITKARELKEAEQRILKAS